MQTLRPQTLQIQAHTTQTLQLQTVQMPAAITSYSQRQTLRQLTLQMQADLRGCTSEVEDSTPERNALLFLRMNFPQQRLALLKENCTAEQWSGLVHCIQCL